MERLARWMWGRWKHRWAIAVAITTAVVCTGFLLVPAAVVTGVIFRLGSADLVSFVGATAFVGTIVVAVGSYLGGRSAVRPIAGWARGDRSEPAAVLAAATWFARDLTPRLALLLPPAAAPVVVWLVFVLLDDSWAAVGAIYLGLVGVSFTAATILMLELDLLHRPLREEVDEHLDGLHSPSRPGASVRIRLGAAMGAAAWACGFIATAATQQVDSAAARFAVAALASAGGAALVTLGIVGPVTITPILRPLEDLRLGTRRVADGVYDARLPLTTDDEFGDLVRSFNEMQAGLQERERLHAAFGSYVDPTLAQRLLAQGDDLFRGEEAEVTVFFADVRDFTPYAEQVTARDAVERLNGLFELVVPILRHHHGHANKFLGDGVLAVFGVPEPVPDHADRAVAAARAVQRAVRATYGEDLRLGIGINTGTVIAGTVGGGGKLEFTLIGDAVNVAARVEQLTKETGDPILLTEATRAALGRDRPTLVSRGIHELKGKVAPTELFAVD